MNIELLSTHSDLKSHLKTLGVDTGGIEILASKGELYYVYIKDLHVGAANILKQDALSIGADLAVPRGTVVAAQSSVDCILIATRRELQILSKKELAQPFGLKGVAKELAEIARLHPVQRVEIMGIINANDDSFFSGSRFKDSHAINAIERMIEEGADIIDIGGVSSKPDSHAVSPQEELERIRSIVDAVYRQKLYEKVRFSLDSYEPLPIRYALDRGFGIINDITALENDAVCKIAAEYRVSVVLMHMQGRPETMQHNPYYGDVVQEVYEFLHARKERAHSFGIDDIILDVGIGFGKRLEDNIKLINSLATFRRLGAPLLVGASRKSMIDQISSSHVDERIAGTLAIHLESIENGASILRVHDVYEHKQAIRVRQSLRGYKEQS
ncbi:MAG: dihydropteroate synthase [Epsilonproteobacteria bacterium]|nr:dihydropteroate synthase [Campylobacterota bacterium]